MTSRRVPSRWILGFLVLGAIVAVARTHDEQERFKAILHDAQPAFLAVIVALQAATYVCLGRAWRTAIVRAHAKPPRTGSLVRIALAELFTDQALPSGGVGGTVFVVTALDRRGVPKPAAGAAVVAALVGFYAAQVVSVIGAAIDLIARHHLVHFAIVVAAISLVVALALPAGVVALAAGARRLPARLLRIRAVLAARDAIAGAPRDVVFGPRTVAPIGALRLLILVLDGATLYAALRAVGSPVPIDAAITAFSLATIASSITFLPGGLGSFEAIAVGLLALYGAPVPAAVAAVLLTRGFTFWLPMLPGLWFARQELRADRHDAPVGGSAPLLAKG